MPTLNEKFERLCKRIDALEGEGAPSKRDLSRFRLWVVELGFPALLYALGFAMTGYLNFWLGLCVMTIAAVFIVFDFWFRNNARSHLFRISSIALTTGIYGFVLGVFLWWLH